MSRGLAVLMARIVDLDGAAVRRADVESIWFSAPGTAAVAINVDDVLFDALQNGGAWTLDDVGYNFRHEIGDEVPQIAARPRCFGLEYELTLSHGETTRLRFQVRAVDEVNIHERH